MKYKAPEGCSGISVGGEQFNTDEQGYITVPDDGNYHNLLAPHGFTTKAAPAEEAPAAEPPAEVPVEAPAEAAPEAPKASKKAKAAPAEEAPAAE